MRRSFALGALAVAAAVAVYALWPHPSSPEEQVRAAVRQMQGGLQDRDLGRVLDHVSEAFHSQTLGDRTDVRRILLGEVLRSGGLHVMTLEANVLPEDGRWRWQGRVAAARLGGQSAGAELQQFHVDALFADEGGHFRLVDATVQPVN